MKLSTVFLLTLMAMRGVCNAQAVHGGLADVSIIDRETGIPLPTHYYHGEYWVAGRPGARYAVEVHNRAGERVLAVTSVDGVNVLSGATAGWDQSGYVFTADERYQITGWRKTDAEVAAFTFASSPHSYAARTGRPGNVGVIGVAIFRERPTAVDIAPYVGQEASRAPAASSVPSAPSTDAAGSVEAPALARAHPVPIAPFPSPKLGTGHGERETSFVSHTDFERQQPQPNVVIRVRYDSLENLVAMGIVAPSRPAWPTVDPFPGSTGPHYVPDPPW